MKARASEPVLAIAGGAERRRTVDELRALAAELLGRDRAVGELLTLLADAVERNLPEDVRAYAAAIPPRTVAEDLTQKHRTIWGVAELVRGALVLLPIALTWYALSAASATYAELITARPDLVAQPFLLLWQRGFEGTGGTISFSALAAIDGALISLIIALSLALHYKADVRDPRLHARTLLRESQVRGLLARCLALSPSAQPVDADVEGRGLAAPALSDAVIALRAYATQLPQLVAAIDATAQRSTEIEQAMREQAERATERDAAVIAALERIGREVRVTTLGAGSLAGDAATAAVDEQARVLEEMKLLVAGLDEVRKAQRTAMGSVGLQTDAMNYMAKALVLASDRVQVAAQTLGDAAVPPVLFRVVRRWRRWLGVSAIAAAAAAVLLSALALLR